MFCQQCGKQSVVDANFCTACGAPATKLLGQSRLVRPRETRMIAGVCAGFALHFGWNLRLLRILLVVVSLLTSGAGLLFYFAAWLLLPDAPYALEAPTAYPPATVPPAYPPSR